MRLVGSVLDYLRDGKVRIPIGGGRTARFHVHIAMSFGFTTLAQSWEAWVVWLWWAFVSLYIDWRG